MSSKYSLIILSLLTVSCASNLDFTNDILDGWEISKDRRTPEGFAKNMSLLFDDLRGQEVLAKALAEHRGEEYNPDPISDWNRKIEAMITDHDPRIQKIGLDLLDDQMLMDTSQIRNQEPNSYREYKMATPIEEQSPGDYNDWLMKRQILRVMNIQDPDAYGY